MTRGRAFGAMLVGLCVACAGGCESDTSPSDIEVRGSWTGTWQFITGGVTVTDTATATLTQNGANAAGTWTAASGPTGDLSFMVGESISGTLTITQTTITGQSCTATTTLAGTASSVALDFTATVTPTGTCQFAASNQFSFRR